MIEQDRRLTPSLADFAYQWQRDFARYLGLPPETSVFLAHRCTGCRERICLSCGARTTNGVLPCGH